MAQPVDFVMGLWLDGLPDEIAREVEALTRLMTDGVLDAVLALAMFEQAHANLRGLRDRDSWEQDRERERGREAELAAADPRPFGAPDYFEWRQHISAQARRDVVREKWAAGELPRPLQHRLPFLHAESFVRSLAQVGRELALLATLPTETASAEIQRASQDLATAVPALKAVRDSVEHAEDRVRGRNKQGEALTLAPMTEGPIHAPGGGVLVAGLLNGNRFGWTTDDGSYQDVEVSDATVELARSAVQKALDALPWKAHGYPHYKPS